MTRRPNAPEETIQQVAALAALGKSTRQIEAVAGVDHSTVARWLNQDEMRRLINDFRPRIAARLSERMWKMVDDESLELSPQQLAVIWGISMDKFDKVEELPASNPTLVIVLPGVEPTPQTGD